MYVLHHAPVLNFPKLSLLMNDIRYCLEDIFNHLKLKLNKLKRFSLEIASM